MNDATPILSRQQPLGAFHAVSCRDAASLDRDGQPFLALNHVDTADKRPLVEVQFADGAWLLVDPDRDLGPSTNT